MSVRALLKGTETHLRSTSAFDDPGGKIVGIQSKGRPPASFGQWYYGIFHAGIRGDDDNALSHDRVYSVGVWITARMGYAPGDRRGERISTADELLDRAEELADELHMSYVVMNLANALITGFGSTTNGFEEPLRFGSIGEVEEKPLSWVHAKDGKDSDKGVLALLVTMVGARRVRVIDAGA